MRLKLRRYKNRCEKLNGGNPVFIPESDPENSKGNIKIMFVNERPGPKTKETDKVSFSNPDPTAKLFKHLFEKTFGLKFRQYVFITNSIIWVPEEEKSKNYKPTKKELLDNLPILREQIKEIKPKLIISLGNSALYSLKHLYKGESKKLNGYTLKKNIGEEIGDAPIPIYPVYHTSSLAQKTRKKVQQESDWLEMNKRIRKFIK